MAKITRIKASDKSDKPKEKDESRVVKRVKVDAKKIDKSKEHKETKAEKPKAAKSDKTSKMPKPLLVLTAPFRALGRYIRDSWREIRQVRWPDRKLTWKMTLSVIVYVIVFAAVIMLLDAFFTFIFNLILGA